MGVLAAAGSRGGASESTAAEPQTPEAPTENGQPRADDGTFVSAAELVPEPPLSRREKARREVEETIKTQLAEFEKRTAAERQSWQQSLEQERQERQRLAQEHARLQGALEEMRSRPATPAAPVQQGPDPDDLRRQARKALGENNYEEYERLNGQAYRIEARKEAEAALKPQLDAMKAEMEKRIQPQMPPHIQTLMMAHRNVAMAGPSGIQAVIAEKQRLDVYRRDLPDQQREAMAFDLADKALAAAQQSSRPAGFDQSAAAALSGVTPSRNGSGGGGGGNEPDGVRLTEAQEAVYQKSRGLFKNRAEYLKWQDPHKYGLAK
jgi:hypothetical protein